MQPRRARSAIRLRALSTSGSSGTHPFYRSGRPDASAAHGASERARRAQRDGVTSLACYCSACNDRLTANIVSLQCYIDCMMTIAAEDDSPGEPTLPLRERKQLATRGDLRRVAL